MSDASAGEVRRLGVARVALGVVFLVRTTPLLKLFPGLLRHHGGPLFGWPVAGGWRVAWAGLVLPDGLVVALVVLRTIAALFFTLGVGARLAGIVAVVCAYLVYAQEPFGFIFTLHTLYLGTLLLALGDATSVVALRPTPPRSPGSSLALIRAFVVSIYFWSAVAKLRGAWLSGETLRGLYEDHYLVGWWSDVLLGTAARAKTAAIGAIVVEASLPPLLLVRRTRVVGIVAACVLHAVIETMAHPDVFGWVMVALLISFWPARRAPDPT